MRRTRRPSSALAAIALLVAGLPLLAAAPSAQAEGPAAPHRRTGEAPELRTRTSTTALNADGTRTTTAHAGTVNYRTRGGWEPVESALVDDPADGKRWRNKANRFTVRFGDAAGDGYMSLSTGSQHFDLSAMGAAAGTPTADGSRITYRDAYKAA
ncbi:MAG: hypothetical protein LC779_06740 [Actinobacteria bacterium]|nr:hypothetical protein [Actinomycetota bacterium]